MCSSLLNLNTSSQADSKAEDCVLVNEMAARRRHIKRNCDDMRKEHLNLKRETSELFTVLKSSNIKELPMMDSARLFVFRYRLKIHHNLNFNCLIGLKEMFTYYYYSLLILRFATGSWFGVLYSKRHLRTGC